MGRELPPADELAIILKWVKQWEEQDREETKRKEAETKEEIDSLNGLSLRAAIYLVLVSAIGFVVGAVCLHRAAKWSSPTDWLPIIGSAALGFCGSGVAALTSCLDRYASGYELKDGEKWPPKATKDTFNQRMARWFFFRPYLGVVMGPVFTWGTDILVKDASSLTNSATHLGFAAFVGGLLAKSIIDVIKGVFKNIFKS